MTQVRDLVQTTKIDDLTPTTIKSAAGTIYLNKGQSNNQVDTVKIVEAYQSVHVPTFGAPIVGSFDISVAPGVGVSDEVNIVAPTANQTYQLLAASINNINPSGTCTGDLILSDGSNTVKLSSSGTVAASTEAVWDLDKLTGPVYFTKAVYIAGVPTAGTAAQSQCKVAYCKVVQ